MDTELLERKPAAAKAKIGVVDCDIHPAMKKSSDIRKYLPDNWQRHYDEVGGHTRMPFTGSPQHPKPTPHLARRDAVPPEGGPPGSSLAFMREQYLDPYDVEIGCMQMTLPNAASTERNIEYGAAICSALNEWQVDEWTSREPRLKASLIVPQEAPELAIKEIRRHAGGGHFTSMLITNRCIEPLGRQRYWPIYAEAEAQGLTWGMHTGGVTGYPATPGSGWPSYYVDWHHMVAQASQAQLTSLVMEGVCEEFPNLKIVMLEGGFSWVPALCWRLDALWEKMRFEVPRVKRPPSEYVRQNFWFGTQPMEEFENPEYLRQVFDWIGWDRVVYASDYPHWDFDDPRYAFPIRMSEAERRMLLSDNARTAFNIH